jgi:hypothetical protein
MTESFVDTIYSINLTWYQPDRFCPHNPCSLSPPKIYLDFKYLEYEIIIYHNRFNVNGLLSVFCERHTYRYLEAKKRYLSILERYPAK